MAFIRHYGVKGMHWGVRRYQNPDGTLTAAGREQRRIRDKARRRIVESRKTEAEADSIFQSLSDREKFLLSMREGEDLNKPWVRESEHAARRAELSGAKDHGNGYGDPYKQYREFIKKQNGIFNRQKPLSRKEFAKLAKLDEMLYSSHDNGKGMNYTIPGFVLEYYSAPGYAASGWKVRKGG